MKNDPDFSKNLFEKLLNLQKKNKESASKKTKTNSSSTSNGTEKSGNTSVPGTPQGFDTKPINDVGTGQIDNPEEQNKSAEEGENAQQSENAQESAEFQVGDEWSKSSLVDFQQRAKGLAAQKADQVQQVHYVVVEPRPPISKIKREKIISAQGVIGVLMISTFPMVQRFLKKVNLKKKKKAIEEKYSFFVNAHVLIQGLGIGEYVVATESCDILNEEFDLNPKIEQFMVGKIVGIIDETIYQVTIQVFPEKHFVYTNGLTYLTPFVPLEEVNYPNWPKSESLKSQLKIPSRRVIEKYYDKIKKSKYFQNIIDFLKYQPFSSK